MAWTKIVFSFVLLAFASLRFWDFESVLLWKLTVLTTEYGHWLAFLPLVILVDMLLITSLKVIREGFHVLNKLRAPVIFTVVFSLAATGLFLGPFYEFTAHSAQWVEQLQTALGEPTLAPPKLSALGIFIGTNRVAPINSHELNFETTGGEKLSLDFYPAIGVKSAPWVLVVHGGGWDSGDRKELVELDSFLARNGVAVVAIDYRLAPKSPWPAPREDSLKAVAFIKAHAAELAIDPSRWVILGRSAGGQIAEAVAYQSTDKTLKGCIAFYAPSDLVFAYEYGHEDDILESRNLLRAYLGGAPAQKGELYRDASPLLFVSASSPPTLLFHGNRDKIVWFRHSERLLQKLSENRVKSVLLEIPWATHGFDYNISGPGGQLSTFAINYFLRSVFE